MSSLTQSKRLITIGYLVSLVIEILYLVGMTFLGRFLGYEAVSFLGTLNSYASWACALVIALGFFTLYQQTRRTDDLVVAVAIALSLLCSFISLGSFAMAAIVGIINCAGMFALAWRLRNSQAPSALVIAACAAIVLLARLVFLSLIFSGNAMGIASMASLVWSVAALGAALVSYLAVRKEFMDEAVPIPNMSMPATSQPSQAAPPTQAAPPKNTFDGSKSATSKAKSQYSKVAGGATVQQLVAQPERSFDEVRSTNAFDVWFQLISNANSPLLTQNNHSLLMSAEVGRPAMRGIASDEKYRELADAMESTARISAGLITQPTNVTVGGKPYDAWLLEHFERRDAYDTGEVETISWDYCLARDGGLFVVTQTSEGDVRVNDMLPFYPAMVADTNKMGLVLVMHGCVGALDLVPADPSLRRTYTYRADGDTLTFDFPWDDDQGPQYYQSALGLTEHLNRLVGQDIWSTHA